MIVLKRLVPYFEYSFRMIFLLGLISFFVITYSYAQTNHIDSLRNLLKYAKEDTNKVNTLNILSWELMDKDYPAALDYSLESSRLAEKLDSQVGLAYAYRNVGTAYLQLKDPNKAIEYFQKCLRIADILNDKILEAKSYGNLGNAYAGIGNDAQALEQYKRASAIIDNLSGNYQLKIALAISIGNLNIKLRDFPKAISSYQYAVEQSMTYGIIDREVLALNNLSAAYIENKEYENAIRYGKNSLEVSKKYRLTKGEINALGNLGTAYQKSHQDNKALVYFNKSLFIALQQQDYSTSAKSLSNIGTIYDDQKNYDKALKYYKQARSYASSVIDGKEIEAKTLTRIGLAYFKKRRYRYSLRFIDSSMAIAQNYKLVSSQIEDAQLLSIAFDTLGRKDSAYKSLQKYVALTEHANDKDTVIKIVKDEKDYELAVQKLKDDEIVKERDEKIENGNRLINVGLFFIFSLITWIVVLYLSRRKNKAVINNDENYVKKILKTNKGRNIVLIAAYCLIFLGSQWITGFQKDEFWSSFAGLISTILTILITVILNKKG